MVMSVAEAVAAADQEKQMQEMRHPTHTDTHTQTDRQTYIYIHTRPHKIYSIGRAMVTSAVAEAVAAADQEKRMQEIGVLAAAGVVTGSLAALVMTWIVS